MFWNVLKQRKKILKKHKKQTFATVNSVSFVAFNKNIYTNKTKTKVNKIRNESLFTL